MKTIVITGSSSGIGKATAKYFAQQGWQVAATMRHPEHETELKQIEGIRLYALDVTDEASITSAREQILNDYDKVDAVLNNAGYAAAGPFEGATQKQIERQFDTNVLGLMRVTHAFLPHFRENNDGLFLNVSSIGGRVTFPLLSLYHGTKWAVEGFSESLSYELAELGIQVKIIEPGGVDTDFSGRSMDFCLPDQTADYNEMLSKYQANRANSGLVSSTPESIAEGIYTAATDGKRQLRYLLGLDAIQVYGIREAQGDDNFVAAIRQRMLA